MVYAADLKSAGVIFVGSSPSPGTRCEMETLDTVLYVTRKYKTCPNCLTLIPDDEYPEHLKDCLANSRETS